MRVIVWPWKVFFNVLGLLGMAIFIASIAIVLLGTKPFEILKAEKVTLGVFENNPAAYHCYKAAGFREDPAKPPAYYPLLGESWKCIDLFIERPENHP